MLEFESLHLHFQVLLGANAATIPAIGSSHLGFVRFHFRFFGGASVTTIPAIGSSHLGFVRFLLSVLRTMEASAKSFDKPISVLASTMTTRIN